MVIKMDKMRKNSILIVDDEKMNIIALTNILSPEYIVFAAKNGRDAVEIANEYMPDVILLDIVMPDMDGYKVINLLKNSIRTQAIPVIFVSGLHDQSDEERGLILGAADYISKPFSPAIVKIRIQNQIMMINYINTIKHLGMTDQLTDLPNRRSFDERIRMEWNRAIRDKTPVSVLYIDLDKFKNFNDSYGHQQGDVVLRTVAKIFAREVKRSADFVARMGGEEFVVMLMNTEASGALEVAERIRQSVESARIPLSNGHTAGVTISIGVHTQIPAPDSMFDEFLGCADNALYTAKRTGRNRACRYEKP